MSMNRPIVLIMFGMLLGASIGFADGLMGLQAWFMQDRPNFFIRPNRGDIHVFLLTCGGTLAGVLYGGVLVYMAQRYSRRLRLARIYCSSLIVAMPIFFGTAYYVIANRVPLSTVSFIPEIVVFLLSVVLAVCLGRDGRVLRDQDRIALKAFGWHRPARLDDISVNKEQHS